VVLLIHTRTIGAFADVASASGSGLGALRSASFVLDSDAALLLLVRAIHQTLGWSQIRRHVGPREESRKGGRLVRFGVRSLPRKACGPDRIYDTM